MAPIRKPLISVLVVGTGVFILLQILRQPALVVHVTGANNWMLTNTNGHGVYLKTHDLLIVSNMRSGTSVLSALLRDSGKVFNVFEPLIPVVPYSYITSNKVCEIGKPVCRLDKQGLRKTSALVLQNIFTCKIRHLPATVLSKLLVESPKSGQPWVDLQTCLGYAQSNSTLKNTCFNTIENTCRNAGTIVVKVVRLGASFVSGVLQQLPWVHVLYLARDPRAIINSRIKTDWFPVQDNAPISVTQNIDSLCYKLHGDLIALRNDKNTNRIRYIAFENLYSNESNLHHVFKFINKTMTVKDLRRVKDIVSKSLEKNISDTWRRTLKPQYRAYIEEKCVSVL